MGRQKKDNDHEYAVSKLKPFWNLDSFQGYLLHVRDIWLQEGSPKWTWILDPMLKYNSEGSYPKSVYRALEGICLDYELPLKPSIKILIRYFRLLDKEEDITIEEVMKPFHQPIIKHWRWFRAARRGLGKLRAEEVEKLKSKDVSFTSKSLKDLRFGLTYEEIASMDGVDARAIGSAVRSCKRFLLVGARDGLDFWSLDESMEELSEDDVIDIVIWANAYFLQNQKQEV